MGPDGLFVSQRTGCHSVRIHVPFTNCFVCRWFCVVHDPKPPLHSHNWLSFGKFQDTEGFLIHCERHFLSRLPLSGGTWKYAKAPSTKKHGEILYLLICFLPCLPWLLRSRVRKSRRDLWITLYLGKFSHSCILNLYLEMSVTISSVFKMYVFVKGFVPKIWNLEMSLVSLRMLVTEGSPELKQWQRSVATG